ncbi:MAG: thioredoxin domain-containing protein, partial [Candidatus Kapaibacterium sp.]
MAQDHTNRLAREKSPYLQQHAHNPVDWFPWGEEAFEKARTENKPIFLYVGYSTCHWCHVMERESFKDEAIAIILNEFFVSIKVDREERPDIDQIYMSALQSMTGSGGWPMSVFLTPDLKPFFAGTYFPPYPAHGRPSFSQLIERIHELWMSDRDALVESGEHIAESLRHPERQAGSLIVADASAPREAIEATYRYFEQAFDRAEGGFGGAPKFPRPVQFDFLFNYFAAVNTENAQKMALYTLRKMAMGGMHDQLGGGFHRYSVDRYWRVSHFEKMLYGQAQLVHSYLDAWQITHDAFFSDTARDICEYILRDLTHPEGGFFSAEDADSEGEEGKFYVWTLDEIESILVKEDAEIAAYFFGVSAEGNFEQGKNVLLRARTIEETIQHVQKPRAFVELRVNAAAHKLFLARTQRIRPLRDEKVLTSWNGLMLGAMARAGDLLQVPRFVEAARRAGEFIWHTLRPSGRLLHRWRDRDEHSPAEARFTAGLDDYAFLIQGYLDLYEATFEISWLHRAVELQEEQDSALYDTKDGGYFDTREAPDLILRMKNEYDGAEPGGNSVSVRNLFRLSSFTENTKYSDRAEETLRFFLNQISNHQFVMPALVAAAFWILRSPTQIVFAGENLA